MSCMKGNLKIITEHPLFIESINKTEEYEKNRAFCCHSIQHLLDTARIAYIINLESGLGYDKEVIYAAAFLHDIGRFREYSDSVEHNKASAEIAEIILSATTFDKEIICSIINAILSHREENKCLNSLSSILYKADKKSRQCYCCKVKDKCKWQDEKKNWFIEY